MNRATNHLHDAIEKGWSIQVYCSDRRLLCSLYPSHGWTLLAGIFFGFVVALIGLNGQISHSSPSVVAPMNAPLNLD